MQLHHAVADAHLPSFLDHGLELDFCCRSGPDAHLQRLPRNDRTGESHADGLEPLSITTCDGVQHTPCGVPERAETMDDGGLESTFLRGLWVDMQRVVVSRKPEDVGVELVDLGLNDVLRFLLGSLDLPGERHSCIFEVLCAHSETGADDSVVDFSGFVLQLIDVFGQGTTAPLVHSSQSTLQYQFRCCRGQLIDLFDNLLCIQANLNSFQGWGSYCRHSRRGERQNIG
mmetsp:Transcript_37610/g.56788  ORF Transcript_37610/g.56788 Transcript_37610/m.56788 type:complete len:229 (+) Transcript_37610:297-983(+)